MTSVMLCPEFTCIVSCIYVNKCAFICFSVYYAASLVYHLKLDMLACSSCVHSDVYAFATVCSSCSLLYFIPHLFCDVVIYHLFESVFHVHLMLSALSMFHCEAFKLFELQCIITCLLFIVLVCIDHFVQTFAYTLCSMY